MATQERRFRTADNQPASAMKKLRPGPGLPRAHVAVHQTQRIESALIGIAATEGLERLTVRALTRNAGISSRTFYVHFDRLEDAVISTVDRRLAEIVNRATVRQSSLVDWRVRIRTAVDSTMNSFAADPALTRLVLVDVAEAGPEGRRRVARGGVGFEKLIADCLTDAPRRRVAIPRHLVGGMAAGVLHIARQTTVAGRVSELPNLAPQLSEWLVSLPGDHVLALGREPKRRRSSGSVARVTSRVRPEDDRAFDGRQRLMRASLRLVLREGFASLSPTRIRVEAGVSRKRFDECFASATDCFLQAVDTLLSATVQRFWPGPVEGTDPGCQAYRTMLALTNWAAQNRGLANLVLADILAPGRAGLLAREDLIRRCGQALRRTLAGAAEPCQLSAEASIAAIWQIAQLELAAGRDRDMPMVAPLFAYLVLAPTLGSGGAIQRITSAGSRLNRVRP
jgi:AcrR family transcriptional regulator